MKLNPGDCLFDRYQVLSKIGEGGFASIYHAYDKHLNRDIAVKVLKWSEQGENNARFMREAKVLAGLTHKNIVSVFAFDFLADNTPVIVMEYLSGYSLQTFLAKQELIPASLLLEILHQLCEGLKYLHASSIIHRDLSPANVFLVNSESGITLKILDFGLSKAPKSPEKTASLLTLPGTIMGNPPYMSPEAATGATVDIRSDLYSLGCIIYECLGGKKAFTADTAVAVIYKQMHEYPEAPQILKEDEEQKLLSEIALRCLQKDPENRFQSCQEIIDLIESKSAVPFPSGSQVWERKKMQNNGVLPVNKAAVIVISIFLALLGMLSIFQSFRKPSRTNDTEKEQAAVQKHPEAENKRMERLSARCKQNPHDLENLDKLVKSSISNKDYTEAIKVLNELIAREKASAPSSNFLVRYFQQLSFVQGENGDKELAEASAMQALNTAELCYGKESAELVLLLMRAGATKRELQKNNESFPLLKRALLIHDRASSPQFSAADKTSLLTNLGNHYLENKQNKEAEACYLRALKLADADANTGARGWILEGLTNLRLSENRYKEAESLAKQHLCLCEKSAEESSLLADGHYPLGGYVTGSLRLLAKVYCEQGRYADASPLLERALALSEKLFGQESSDYAQFSDLLATNYLNLGKEADAKRIESRLEAIKARASKKDARKTSSDESRRQNQGT